MLPKISVLIPVRNEAKSIRSLLEDLNNQRYPHKLFEVIIIDDHSIDTTLEVIDSVDLTFELKVLSNVKEGKKAAIELGNGQANGKLIVQTDGDCRVGENWLSSIASHYGAGSDVLFLTGPIGLESSSSLLLGVFQQYEMCALMGITGGSIRLGFPTMANGANMAYRKKTFELVNGYEGNSSVASGDDEFLMHKIRDKHTSKQIAFNNDQDAIVKTQTVNGFWDFVEQRTRWAGKWKKHGISASSIFPMYLFSFYLMLILTSIVALFNPALWPAVTLVVAIKVIAEILFMVPILNFFNKTKLIWLVLPIQIIYPFYVMFFGMLSFRKSYKWKERKLS